MESTQLQLMMKQLIAVSAGLLICLGTGSVAWAQDSAANLLKNGGAEEGTDKTVAAWTFSNPALPGDQGTYGVSDVASAGKQGFFISATKAVPLNLWLVQEVKLPAGTKSAQISCKARSQVDAARTQYAAGIVGCYFLDANNQWINWQPILTVPESKDWATLAGNVAVPAGAARMGVRLNLMSSGVASVWFDDVQAIPSPSYQNVVINGDFEASDSAAPGWALVRKKGAEKSMAGGVSAEASEGKHALRLAAVDNGLLEAYWAQTIGATPGISRYQLKLKGKVNAAAGAKQADAMVTYAFLDKDRREIGALPAGLVTSANWSEISASISAPPEAAYLEIRLGLTGAGATEALFDSVSLLPVS